MTDSTGKVCLYHSGIEKELRTICVRIDEKADKIHVQFNMMERSIESVRSDLDRRLQELRKEFDLIADKFDLRIRAIGLENSEKKGERTWESHIITVLISLAVVMILHYIFKF